MMESMSTAAEIAAALKVRNRDVLLHLFPAGKFVGHEFRIGSIKGEAGQSLRVNVNGKDGVWCDFAANQKGGDLLDLWRAKCGGDMKQAMREAAEFCRMEYRGPGRPPNRPNGDPSIVYDYTDADGNLIFQVRRWEANSTGKKRFLPLTDGANKAPPKPWPLYRLAALATEPSRDVLIVEGEKAADGAALLDIDCVPVSWPFGSNAVDSADLSPLRGRRCILWPDNDAEGIAAMNRMAERLKGIAADVHIVHMPDSIPPKWDLGDPLPAGRNDRSVQLLIDATRNGATVTRLSLEGEQGPGTYSTGDRVPLAPEVGKLPALDLPDASKDATANFKGEYSPVPNTPTRLVTASTRRWMGKVPKPTAFAADGLFPIGKVTLLTAEGGAGKSLLMQSAAYCVGAGIPFLGKSVTTGAAYGLFAEDDDDTLHGRHQRICDVLRIDPETIADRCLIDSYADKEAVLWADDKPTKFMVELESDLQAIEGLTLVLIDNSALVYGGDEMNRNEVTRFLHCLSGMASRLRCALVLSTHKSKSDDGTTIKAASGSTAWINRARHVLELKPETEAAGPTLKCRKSNVMRPSDLDIKLTWDNSGVLVEVSPASTMDISMMRSRLDNAILTMTREAWDAGQPFSKSANAEDRYLPAVMARKGFKKTEAKTAMLTMLDNGVLKNSERTSKRRGGLYVA